MKHLLLAALLAGTCATPALAKEFQLPEANPGVSITLPDAWEPEAIDTGAQATSPDGGAYVAAETATRRSTSDLIKDDIKFLNDNGVTIDTATQQEKDTTLNGMPATLLRWQGKDKDGPTAITLVIAGVSDNLILLVTAWASPDAEKKFSSQLSGVLDSMHRM